MNFISQATPRYRGAGAVSPQFTTAAPGISVINDTHGNAWRLTTGGTAPGPPNGQISINGVVDATTGSVYKLVYIGLRIWQYTRFGWYFKLLTSDAWTFDPGPVTASGTIVNIGDPSAVVDASAYVWQITAGGQIKADGVIDATTASVTKIEYFGGQIWQFGAGSWYKKTVPSDAWVFSATAPGVSAPGTRPTILGAQLGDPGNGDATIFNQFKAAMNESPTLFTTYAVPDQNIGDWSNLQIWHDVAGYSAHGINVMNGWAGAAPVTIPFVGIPMAKFQNTADQDYIDIQNGGWDARFTAILDEYVSHGFSDIIIRPGWEMNGDWEAWSRPYGQVDPSFNAAFALTFRHIAQHAYAYAGTHPGIKVTTCWNPGYLPDSNRPNFNQLWPGDAYVDHIGIDTYGLCSNVPDDGPLRTFPGDPTHFSMDDAITMCIAKNKPLCFGETGCTPGETTFMNNVKTKMLQNPNCKVSFVAIWDQPTGCGPNALWSTDGNSGAAWKSMFNAIRSTNGPWG